MTGDVHEAEAEGVFRGTGQIEMRESDVDGNAAPLLFLQPIGVDAGQCLDQCGLPVIDVAGGTDNGGLHRKGIILDESTPRLPSDAPGRCPNDFSKFSRDSYSSLACHAKIEFPMETLV